MSTDWNSGAVSGLVALPNTTPERSLYLAGMGPTRQPGSKEPAIIIEHGLGGTRWEWLEVQRRVARFARIYVYERAGYHPSSDVEGDAWTAKGVASDLRALLDAAGVQPPYVLVGQSLGGLLVRRCLADWGKGVVAGLVIVDAQVIRIPLPKNLDTLFGGEEMAKVLGMDKKFVMPRGEFEKASMDDSRNERITGLEWKTGDEEMVQLRDEIGGRPVLGDGPLSVIFCDESVDVSKILEHAEREGNGTAETRDEVRKSLVDMSERFEASQRAHLTVTSRGRFVKAEGEQRTHNVHMVDPDFVVKEIEWVWRESTV